LSEPRIITIEFNYQKTRFLFDHKDRDDLFLPPIGQKKFLFTFRVFDCPPEKTSEEIGQLIVDDFIRLDRLPNTGLAPWTIAYNVTYDQLASNGIVSLDGNISINEAARIAERTIDTIEKAISDKKLATSRPPISRGGTRPHVINRADFQYYLDHRQRRGRPEKK
jgi:hypothetical protein